MIWGNVKRFLRASLHRIKTFTRRTAAVNWSFLFPHMHPSVIIIIIITRFCVHVVLELFVFKFKFIQFTFISCGCYSCSIASLLFYFTFLLRCNFFFASSHISISFLDIFCLLYTTVQDKWLREHIFQKLLSLFTLYYGCFLGIKLIKTFKRKE